MHTKFRIQAALIGAVLAGMLVAVQSRINGGLSQELGGGFVPSVYSFGSGLVLVVVLMLCSKQAMAGFGKLRDQLRSGRFPVWALFGGAAGAFFVLGQTLVAPALGVALFTVGVVAGQVVGGLVLDQAGIGPGGRVAPTATRLIGTALVIVAVVISVAGSLGEGVLQGSPWLVVVPLLSGFAVAWQSAVNGLLRSAMGSVLSATFVSFVCGTVILLVLALVALPSTGLPQAWPTEPVLYLGGVLGVVFIASLAILVRVAGVLLLGMGNVAGQLIASVLLELSVPLAGGLSVGMMVGALVAMVAVVIAALPKQRANESTTSQ